MNVDRKYEISNRFFASLVFNILRGFASFLSVIFIARWLGPQDYGTMVFLLTSFVAFQAFIDMASTSAFFTFLSKKKRSKKFIQFYWRWISIQFFLSFFVIYVILPDSIINSIWQGESRTLIILAFVASFMQQTVWGIISQMAEANRESVKIQKISALFTIGHFFVVFILWKFGMLMLPVIFVALFLEWGVASIYASRLYYGENSEQATQEISDTVSSVFKEFWIYCWPFIPMVFFTFIHNFSSVWMLQEWGGSTEQAFHGIGIQFASIPMVITASLLKIFWKEIAEAKYLGDMNKVKILYFKTTRGLFIIGSIFAGAVIPWSKEIITLFLGNSYIAGTLPLMLMLIYPVHQSYGQLTSAMLYATENTKTQVILSIIFALIGTLVAFLLLSPKAGLQLAAIGLATKMVFVQIIEVNTRSYIISRIFNWKFDWLFQITGLLTCIMLGWICKLLGQYVLGSNIFIFFPLCLLVYIILVCFFIYLNPSVTGFKIYELKKEIKNIINYINIIKLP